MEKSYEELEKEHQLKIDEVKANINKLTSDEIIDMVNNYAYNHQYLNDIYEKADALDIWADEKEMLEGRRGYKYLVVYGYNSEAVDPMEDCEWYWTNNITLDDVEYIFPEHILEDVYNEYIEKKNK